MLLLLLVLALLSDSAAEGNGSTRPSFCSNAALVCFAPASFGFVRLVTGVHARNPAVAAHLRGGAERPPCPQGEAPEVRGGKDASGGRAEDQACRLHRGARVCHTAHVCFMFFVTSL